LWRLFSRTVYRGIMLLFAHKSREHKQRKVRRGETGTEDRRQGSEKRLKTREKKIGNQFANLMKRISQHIVATIYVPVGSKFVRSKIHCKKRLSIFPSPAGMALTKLFLDRNNFIITVTSRLGTGNR
jgi:hypothetical protein